MSNLPDYVLKEVLKKISPTSDVLEFLYTVLLREERNAYPAFHHPVKALTQEYVDIYAYCIIFLLKQLPEHTNADDGLRVCIANLLHLTDEDVNENHLHVPQKFRPTLFGKDQLIFGEFTLRPDAQIYKDILNFWVGIRIPHYVRREHTYILGGTGAGKTQLIQQLITQDLETNASIVVIDSQNDLINKLKNTSLIDSERLVIIDPVDSIKYPLALNMFDMGQEYFHHPDPVEHERHINTVVEQLNFVFSAVMDSPFTDKQSVLFNFCVRLMLEIPEATIFTLVDLLKSGTDDYQTYIDQLDELTRNFFHTAFPEGRVRSDFTNTRMEILRRLYTL